MTRCITRPAAQLGSGRVSSVGEEKSLNPRFAGQTREQFIELMAGLNLPKPKLIDVAVPANKRAGESHAA